MGASHAQEASLHWENLHSVLSYKRLSRGRFLIPSVPANADHVVLDGTQLAMLLGGFDPLKARRVEAWEPSGLHAPIR